MAIISDHYSNFGESAVYTKFEGGEPTSVTILIDAGQDLEPELGLVRQKAIISVRQSEVADRPGYRDTFKIDDGSGTEQTFTVVDHGVKELRAFLGFDGEWSCACSADERVVV